MGFFSNLFADIRNTAKSAADGKANAEAIAAKLAAFRSLRNSLQFQWRKLESEWKKASSVDENLNRTPLARAQSIRRAKSLAKRMSVIGRIANMVETFEGVLQQSQQLSEHVEQMKAAAGDMEQFKKLGEQVNRMMAQNKEMVDGLAQLQETFDDFQTQMDEGLVPENEKIDNARLNELYEKLEDCRMSTKPPAEREEEAKKIEAEIQSIMAGGSSLLA